MWLRLSFAFGCIAAVTNAQVVWNVTAPNGIQAAIQAASPGDIVVLTAGTTYDAFHLDRGLTIRGNGATISTLGGIPSVIVNPWPGQVAHLDELNFTAGWGPWGSLGCPVLCNGAVRIDRCKFLSRSATPALTVGFFSHAVIVGSSITASGLTGSAAALQCSQSVVTLRDCTVAGSNTGCSPLTGCSSAFQATDAATFLFCLVHAERTTFSGGSHALSIGALANGAAAIDDIAGTLRLADCVLTGGSSVWGTGGTALLHTGPTPVDLRACQLTAGTPGGTTSTGALNPTAPLVRLQLEPVWTRGLVSTLTVQGDPNTLHAVFLTPAPGALASPLVVEPVWSNGAAVVAAGLLDPSGAAVYAVPVPNLATLQHAPVWCQAVSGSTLPLRATTIAGGVVR